MPIAPMATVTPATKLEHRELQKQLERLTHPTSQSIIRNRQAQRSSTSINIINTNTSRREKKIKNSSNGSKVVSDQSNSASSSKALTLAFQACPILRSSCPSSTKQLTDASSPTDARRA